jgi:hypothetical protein
VNEDSAKRDEWARISVRLGGSSENDDDRLTLDREEHVSVVFLGEPWAYDAAWHNDRKRWVQSHRSPMPVGSSLRVRINVFIEETEELKWWDICVDTFKAIYSLREMHGLDRWVFDIKATEVSQGGACVKYLIRKEHYLYELELARIQRHQLFTWETHEKTLE